MSLRVLHIGDLHFWRIPYNPIALFNKRLLGVGNLLVGGRARRFKQHLAPMLVEKAASINPDYFLFSGDLSSTSLPSEFRAASKILAPILPTSEGRVFTVPGNHDCYFQRERQARSFLKELGKPFGVVSNQLIASIGDHTAVYCVNATTSNKFGSHGAITPDHLRFVEEKVIPAMTGIKRLLILCHFPPEDPPGVLRHDRGPQLMNSAAFLHQLSNIEVPIVWLHGHHHHRWSYGSPTVENLVYLNAGAPTLSRSKTFPDLGFHELAASGDALTLQTHYFSKKSDGWLTHESELAKPGEYIDLQHLTQ